MINYQFATLHQLINKRPWSTPVDLVSAIEKLPHSDTLPSPEATWFLICIFRHRQMQMQLKQDLVRDKPELFFHDFQLPDLAACNDEFIEWKCWNVEQLMCGEALLLVHRATEAVVVINIRDDHHPIHYWEVGVRGRHIWMSPEWRSDALRGEYFEIALQELDSAKFLRRESPGHYAEPLCEPDFYVLTNRALLVQQFFLRFAEQWNDASRRLWLSCLIGDWELAAEIAAIEDRRAEFEKCRSRARTQSTCRENAQIARRHYDNQGHYAVGRDAAAMVERVAGQ